MDFALAQHIILEDDRVLLRLLQESDLEQLLKIAANDPDTWKYSLVPADSRENLEKYIQTAVKGYDNQTAIPFIVFDKKTNLYAGSTRFYDINFQFKTMLLGYTWYGEQFRGTGLNKHCKYLLLKYAFENLMIERVEFRADSNNSRSIAAMKSIGCTVEGILRNHMPTFESKMRRDTIVLSILRKEWFETVKDNLFHSLK
jgi:RimJ/RimL family protein N-acetyltransferase